MRCGEESGGKAQKTLKFSLSSSSSIEELKSILGKGAHVLSISFSTRALRGGIAERTTSNAVPANRLATFVKRSIVSWVATGKVEITFSINLRFDVLCETSPREITNPSHMLLLNGTLTRTPTCTCSVSSSGTRYS
ncbi:unannotated protein [freshwater metagenome]|uniref:Unannotated protein n=1 Tax=freshwater metagenome TaxID=449393 RepID=A0A6J7GBH3_9ZZZZ